MRERVIIIAEAGVNHNGSLENAKRLIKVAAEAGADYIKFQTFKADKLVSKVASKAEYQKRNFLDTGDSQYEMLKKMEMPYEWHYELIEYSEKNKIKFLSTGFDEDSIDFLSKLNLDLFKIPSGEITNKPYLQHIASKKKPIIISTGMANMSEIQAALDVLVQNGVKQEDVTVLHCNTEYPTPMSDVNLLAIINIKNELGVKVGYSDHTLGIEVPIAAVALGAVVIEKHFTLDKSMAGPDHLASLNPEELFGMVKSIRNIEKVIAGTGIKEPSSSELKNRIIARKSIHLKNATQSGYCLRSEDLIMLRPGDGISPMQIDEIIGRRTATSLEKGHKLTFKDIL